jgi:hypothetical protein
MAFIGKIPEALLSKLFTEFLDCLDLGNLDSAICNVGNRNDFLNIGACCMRGVVGIFWDFSFPLSNLGN